MVIACFGEEIAPLFDSARCFRYWEIANGEAHRYRELANAEMGALSRIRLLRELQTHVLICNGIEQSGRELLEASGCQVINGVRGPVNEALCGFLDGQITAPYPKAMGTDKVQPHSADLVTWTVCLFKSLDWEVHRVLANNLYPIDLLAKRLCPICQKNVRAAVCCGAHAYQVEEEIRELNRVSASGYHARVYVHHAVSGVARTCRDFGVELLDPDDFSHEQAIRASSLPPLKGRIIGHDKLNEF
jgi:predicted Fe-Mo cluster-binding NifX family protein